MASRYRWGVVRAIEITRAAQACCDLTREFPSFPECSGLVRGRPFLWLAPFVLSWSGVLREHIERVAVWRRTGVKRMADHQLEIPAKQQNLEQARTIQVCKRFVAETDE